ncbi:FAD-dependent monooxygenase [Sphaerisporangium fuscum]|uniref:FAD-dependent monooxygenase n=1 Tax=Sphaerisporangium fuscum TaxID=2835868 RepID=UPI001BDD8EBA|nr:FAD-dependent monooxygenase [Sphaerisporangium fuscum]
MLEERARELGVPIRRGHEVVALSQDEQAVHLTVRGPEGGHEMRAAYLVGCDGAHSVVRKQAGIGFPGVTPCFPSPAEGWPSAASSGAARRTTSRRCRWRSFRPRCAGCWAPTCPSPRPKAPAPTCCAG